MSAAIAARTAASVEPAGSAWSRRLALGVVGGRGRPSRIVAE